MSLIDHQRDREFLEKCQKVSETTLHTELVGPMLTEIGMKAVRYSHGPNERGKDFYYCIEDCYGETALHACVVKNQKFNARAGHANSVQTALAQIEQSFQTTILNPLTNVHETPKQVLFISPYALPDAGAENSEQRLAKLRGLTRFLTADRFAEFVRERAPQSYYAFLGTNVAISQVLESSITPYSEAAAFGIDGANACAEIFVNLTLLPTNSSLFERIGNGLFPDNLSGITFPWAELNPIIEQATVLRRLTGSPPLLELAESGANAETSKRGTNRQDAVSLKKIGIHAAIESVDFNVTDYQSSEQLDRFDATLSYVDLLDFICGTRYGDDDFSKDAKRAMAAAERLTLSRYGTQILMRSRHSFLLNGAPGAGKTFTAREICRLAHEHKIKCIYFPCSQIRDKNTDLHTAIVDYFTGSNKAITSEAAVDAVAQAELIVLDACDEAASVDTRLSRDIFSFSLPKALAFKDIKLNGFERNISSLVPDAFEIKSRGEKGEIRLIRRLTLAELDVLSSIKDTSDFRDVLEQLLTFHSTLPRLIITCRAAVDLTIPPHIMPLALQPLSDDQLLEIVGKWGTICNKSTKELVTFLESNPHVKDICRSPMTATILTAIYFSDASLPHSRSELYQRRFDLLLGEWDRIRGVRRRNEASATIKLRFLSKLAFAMHKNHEQSVSTPFAIRIWNKDFQQVYPNLTASQVIDELITTNGVLDKDSSGQLSLGHLSLQEYLAALEIVNRQDYRFLSKNFNNPWWNNVIVFYSGITGNVDKLLSHHQENYSLERNALITEVLNEAQYGEMRSIISEVIDYDD